MKFEHLTPKIRFNKLIDVRVEYLKQNNISCLWLDVDNTVTEWGSSDVSQDVLSWVNRIKDADITVALVTNCNKNRIDVIAEKLGIDFYKGA